jgi:ketosteroid isomerase-like protein
MESGTSQRLAVVERVHELFNRLPATAEQRRASPATAELLDLFDPEVEFTQPAMQPEGAQFFKGREELRESWDQWFEVWENHRSFLEEMHERDDHVLVLSRNRFRGRDGIELEVQGAAIFSFKGPRISRLEAFFDRESAWREFQS